eukprot:scaffold662685_cov60-Prasinocladus_malaysianus.AAC.1
MSMTSANGANSAEAGRLGLLVDIQRAMRKHEGHARVQDYACRAVFNMTSGNEAISAAAGR